MSTDKSSSFNFSMHFLSFLEGHLKKIIVLIVLLTSGFLIKEWQDNNIEKKAKKIAQGFYVIQKKIETKEKTLLEEVNVKNKNLKKKQKKYVVIKNKEKLKIHFSGLVLQYKSLLQKHQQTAVFFGASLKLAQLLHSYKDFKSSVEVLTQVSTKIEKTSLFYPFIFQALGISYLELGEYNKAVKAFVKITSEKQLYSFIQPSSLLNLSLAYFQLKQWELLKQSIAELENTYPKSNEASTAQAIGRYLVLNEK